MSTAGRADHTVKHPDPLRHAHEQPCLTWWIDHVRHAREMSLDSRRNLPAARRSAQSAMAIRLPRLRPRPQAFVSRTRVLAVPSRPIIWTATTGDGRATHGWIFGTRQPWRGGTCGPGRGALRLEPISGSMALHRLAVPPRPTQARLTSSLRSDDRFR
jgi:hypothetical protein